jgi:hypothetical protein
MIAVDKGTLHTIFLVTNKTRNILAGDYNAEEDLLPIGGRNVQERVLNAMCF